MSKITIALEAAVATVIENRANEGERQTARQRANVDKAFARILKLIAPRIRHFIRQYGLVAHWDDAEQCCAIGVHRAIEAYDPTKAQFTTFVNWQLRGELQSLRFRLMTDQRASAKKVEATTVSLHAIASGPEGEETSLEGMIEDENALERTESGASDYLAKRSTAALIEEYVRHNRNLGLEQLRRRPQPKRAARQLAELQTVSRSPFSRLDPAEVEKLEAKLARDREVLERRVFEEATLDEVGTGTGITKEQIRQISKRATRGLAEIASTQPRFAIMAQYGAIVTKPAKTAPARTQGPVPQLAAETRVSLLPEMAQGHSSALRVVAVDTSETLALSSLSEDASADALLRSVASQDRRSLAA